MGDVLQQPEWIREAEERDKWVSCVENMTRTQSSRIKEKKGHRDRGKEPGVQRNTETQQEDTQRDRKIDSKGNQCGEG